MNRGRLKLDNLAYVVLDEADQMLNMVASLSVEEGGCSQSVGQGFAEDIETILKGVAQEDPKDNRHQTLLYSATMPKWVQQATLLVLAKRFSSVAGGRQVCEA